MSDNVVLLLKVEYVDKSSGLNAFSIKALKVDLLSIRKLRAVSYISRKPYKDLRFWLYGSQKHQ
ncbi:MAG: hypothetical protein WBO98_02425, partial [Candidatus Nitrotoga sp.]